MLKQIVSLGILISLLLGIMGSLAQRNEVACQKSDLASSFMGQGWLEGWTYRKLHNITGSLAGDKVNYPVMINVRYDYGVDFEGQVYLGGKCRADFGDIRFTDSTGENCLDYWIQQKVIGVQALIWVEINYIPQSPDYATMYMYYGSENASTTGNKDWTFDLATDFEDGSTQGWSISWSSYVVSDGVSTFAFEGNYSRRAGRVYGSGNAGNGDFYERFRHTIYLSSGTYRMEGAAMHTLENSYIKPKEITLLANGVTVDNLNNPGTVWHWLDGNFTLGTSSYIELDVEFHVWISSYLETGTTGYQIIRCSYGNGVILNPPITPGESRKLQLTWNHLKLRTSNGNQLLHIHMCLLT